MSLPFIPINIPSFTIEGDFPREAFLLASDLDQLGFDIRSFKEPLTRSVRNVIIPSIRKNFESGGRPAWPDLAEETIKTRTREGYGVWPPLTKTGKLKKRATAVGIWSITKDSATMNEPRIKYARYHQGGTRKMPQRVFAMIQDDDEEKVEEVFRIWLEERIERYYARG